MQADSDATGMGPDRDPVHTHQPSPSEGAVMRHSSRLGALGHEGKDESAGLTGVAAARSASTVSLGGGAEKSWRTTFELGPGGVPSPIGPTAWSTGRCGPHRHAQLCLSCLPDAWEGIRTV